MEGFRENSSHCCVQNRLEGEERLPMGPGIVGAMLATPRMSCCSDLGLE
jgi:hypothetical protein